MTYNYNLGSVDYVFANMLNDITTYGEEINSRNATTRRAVSLTTSFVSTPLISVRKTAWKNCLREWEWFMSGSSNINDLHTSVHSWWKPWAASDGEIKNNYSKQFRHYEGGNGVVLDQVKVFIEGIKEHPFSRRNVITTWDSADMWDPTIPITNCHGTIIQAFVDPKNRLELLMYQRSCDMLLGVPHNWLQYWAFMLYVAKQTGTEPYKFSWHGGDCHVYESHFSLVKEIYDNKNTVVSTPQLVYNGKQGDEFKAEDFTLSDTYSPVLQTRAEMVV